MARKTPRARGGANPNIAALHAAIEAGDVAKVRSLVDTTPSLATEKHNSTAPIARAISPRNPDAYSEEIVLYLLEKGADASEPLGGGFTPLHFARSAAVANALLAKGADVNALHTASKSAPLHIASEQGTIAVVRALLAGGADRTLVDFDGNTPYDLAVENDHDEIAELVRPTAETDQEDPGADAPRTTDLDTEDPGAVDGGRRRKPKRKLRKTRKLRRTPKKVRSTRRRM